MAYSRETFASVREVLQQRRNRAQIEAAALRERMMKEIPRLAEIDTALSQTAGAVAQAILQGGGAPAAVEDIRRKNLALQDEMAALLKGAGLTVVNFEPQYTCSACQDTGYVGGKPCHCLTTLLKETACRSISGASAMTLTDFDTMRLDYYPEAPENGVSPRARMRDVLTFCRSYAEEFDLTVQSLLLRGPTGTGKTHAALAIAKVAAGKGYSVIYGPTQILLHKIQKEYFGRADGNTEEALQDCDLLILDDLGTEMTGPFFHAALYNIINGRLMAEKPTIISTNFDQKQLLERYGEQITSRIIGTYEPLVFFGKDIRQLKLKQSLQ